MNEDALLLRRYADRRDEGAFTELVQRHLNPVYSAAMRRTGGNSHQAQEIVQFVFNKLALNAAAVARHPTLSGWLHTASRNAAFNAARSERRRQHYEQEASRMHEILAEDSSDADWTHVRSVLDEVIDELGHQDRDAVVLRFLEGRPFPEIGRTLQISEGAARMRTERALEKLRGLLARRGVTSTAAVLSAGLTVQTLTAAPTGLAAIVTGTALAQAVSAGGAGVFTTLWAALTGTKIALATTGAIVTVAAGVAAFAVGEGSERPEPGRPVGSGPASHASSASSPAVVATPVPATLPARVVQKQLLQLAPAVEPAGAKRPAVAPAETDPNWATTRLLRSNLLRDYAPLFARLGEPQREQLLALLVNERQAATDFAAAGGAAGVDVTADPGKFSLLVRDLREKTFDEIFALLGPEGYQEYENLRTTLQLQAWVNGLEKKLRRTSNALSSEQHRRFATLLLSEGLDPRGPAAVAAAGQFLSAPQVAAFRQLQQQNIAGWQKREVREAVREGAAQANPARK